MTASFPSTRNRILPLVLAIYAVWLLAPPAGAQDIRGNEGKAEAPMKPSVSPQKWKLVWSDEFDYEGKPDPAKWDYERGFVRNHELQYYTDRLENARVEDGKLILEGRRESFPNAGYKEGSKEWNRKRKEAEYTSGCVITKGKAAWTGGRIEVRAKLPGARGTWPAIWTLGLEPTGKWWPRCGEIDIMEAVGHRPGKIFGTVHTGDEEYKHYGKGGNTTLKDPYGEFHVYAIDWTQEGIDWYVDGKLFFTYPNEGKGDTFWPFHWPQYLLLNLAIGGSWGGEKGVDAEAFPQRMEVDYVRVYEPEK